jgi:hypothetical protein
MITPSSERCIESNAALHLQSMCQFTYGWLVVGYSVALVIDNADMFRKLAPKLRESANVKFVVLLWGDKSSIVSTNGSFLKDTPIHTFDEFIELGRGSRKTSSGEYSIICKV